MKKPKLEKLIQEIAMFDMDVAFTLYCRMGNEGYKDKDNLDKAMSWRETPEGYEYWHKINEKLEARRKKYHPHRDLMIEYANDKTIEIEVYVDEKWIKCREPAFYQDVKYRKKPNVTKKVIEYRIYLNKENEIIMVERQDMIKPAHFKGWLGGWQKVEIDVEQND